MSAKIHDSLGYTVVFTFLLTFVFVFGLAFLYGSLSSTIANNASLAQKRSVLEAMGAHVDPQDSGMIEDLYSKLTVKFYKKTTEGGRDSFELLESSDGKTLPVGANITFYETVLDTGKVVGVTFGGGGMWGQITGVVSTNEDVSKTVGIQIISHNETPGLGARITSDSFRDQFSRGVDLVDGTIKLVKDRQGNQAGEINAITGASVTSGSMNGILKEGYTNLKEIVEVTREQ